MWGLTFNLERQFPNNFFGGGLTGNKPVAACCYAPSAIAYFFVNLKTLRSFMA